MAIESKANSAKEMPAYMSLTVLEKLINLISSRKLSEVTTDYLVTYGFGRSDAYLGLATLRFLNLIDDQGKTNETIKKFLIQGEQGKNGIKTIVETAYEKIFFAMDNPQNLDPKELINEFIHQYDLSPRVARSAVPAFLYLCERAGLKEPTIQIKKRSTDATGQKKSFSKPIKQSSQDKPDMEEGTTQFPFGDGRVKLFIPHDATFTKIVLSKEFRDVSGAIEKFADAFFSAKSEAKESNSHEN